MKRFAALVAVLLAIPTSAMATDLEELLERGHQARYSAEQIITCSTPDGVKDAIVRIRQDGGDLHASAPVSSDVEVTTGYGGWTLSHGGVVVTRAELGSSEEVAEPRYEIDDGTTAAFLGRRATLYEMSDGDTVRAHLIIDNQVGALMKVVTYTDEGDVYCERRFIAFDPTPPTLLLPVPGQVDRVNSELDANVPSEIAGFHLLDHYDEDGLKFSYYSDGFFSFAVFETDRVVNIGQGSEITIDGEDYVRAFAPGQVTFAWETRHGGMALIGDLPPDMHRDVLEELPGPGRIGWWGRLWRGLFG